MLVKNISKVACATLMALSTTLVLALAGASEVKIDLDSGDQTTVYDAGDIVPPIATTCEADLMANGWYAVGIRGKGVDPETVGAGGSRLRAKLARCGSVYMWQFDEPSVPYDWMAHVMLDPFADLGMSIRHCLGLVMESMGAKVGECHDGN